MRKMDIFLQRSIQFFKSFSVKPLLYVFAKYKDWPKLILRKKTALHKVPSPQINFRERWNNKITTLILKRHIKRGNQQQDQNLLKTISSVTGMR